MKLSKINRPKILLVGAGNFGRHHLQDLKRLDKEGEIEFVGVVEKGDKSKKISQDFGVKTFTVLNGDLLKSVDAVDIATPPATHMAIAKQCLQFADVFLEKPIALDVNGGLELYNLSKKNNRVLFLGHIYRFHPALNMIKQMMQASENAPFFIECIFWDAPEKVPQDCGILYSDLHGLDIIDYLIEQIPETVMAQGKKIRNDSKFEDEVEINLNYPSKLKGVVKLSWVKKSKIRKVSIHFSDKIIEVDLISRDILIKKDGDVKKIKGSGEMPLELELRHFVEVLKGEKVDFPDGLVGARIVNIVSCAERSMRSGHVIKIYEQ